MATPLTTFSDTMAAASEPQIVPRMRPLVSVLPGLLALVMAVSLIGIQPGDFFGRDRQSTGVDYSLISENARRFSDTEFATWTDGLIGSEVGWHGEVEQARESSSDAGEFELVVNVRDAGEVLDRAHVQVPESLALAIPTGSDIFFTGAITDIDNAFTLIVDVDNATIEEPDGAPFVPRAGTTTALARALESEAADTTGISYEILAANARSLNEAGLEDWAAMVLGAEVRWQGVAEQVRQNPDDESSADVVVEVLGATDVLERTVVTVPRAEAIEITKGAEVIATGSIAVLDNTLALRVALVDGTITTVNDGQRDRELDPLRTPDLDATLNSRSLRTNGEQLSQLQFQEWIEPSIGGEFAFSGRVARVEEADRPGEFQIVVHITGDANNQAFLLVTADAAPTLTEDEVIRFTGTLTEASNEVDIATSFVDVSYRAG